MTKFLIDMPLSPKTSSFLTSQGYDSIHLYHLNKSRATDKEVIELAKSENRIIITMDLDFPTILAHSHTKIPGVILIRMSYATIERINKRLSELLKMTSEEDIFNSIVVLEDAAVRLRKLPLI